MTLEEKFSKWSDLYFSRFIYLGNPAECGTNIPLEKVNLSTGEGVVGDGTVNIAGLMQLLFVMDLMGETKPASMLNMLYTISRLHISAHDYFKDKFPSIVEDEVESGFFLRDDISKSNEAFLESTGLKSVISNLGMLETLDGEDPCHSPFVSQDQVWNLSPILMAIGLSYKATNHDLSELAFGTGYNLNKYIKDNGYTVYNPYLSQIYHFFTYLNLNVDYDRRQQERKDAYRPSIKVKRGANNWYYSGGTKAAVDAFQCEKREYEGSLRTFLYKGELFFLDRIWEPVLQLLGGSFKHNAIYCYAATSGIWYSGGFAKRVVDRANRELKKGNLFEPNILFLAGEVSELDFDLLKDWLEAYPEPATEGWVTSPIDFLYTYKWYQRYMQ